MASRLHPHCFGASHLLKFPRQNSDISSYHRLIPILTYKPTVGAKAQFFPVHLVPIRKGTSWRSNYLYFKKLPVCIWIIGSVSGICLGDGKEKPFPKVASISVKPFNLRLDDRRIHVIEETKNILGLLGCSGTRALLFCVLSFLILFPETSVISNGSIKAELQLVDDADPSHVLHNLPLP